VQAINPSALNALFALDTSLLCTEGGFLSERLKVQLDESSKPSAAIAPLYVQQPVPLQPLHWRLDGALRGVLELPAEMGRAPRAPKAMQDPDRLSNRAGKAVGLPRAGALLEPAVDSSYPLRSSLLAASVRQASLAQNAIGAASLPHAGEERITPNLPMPAASSATAESRQSTLAVSVERSTSQVFSYVGAKAGHGEANVPVVDLLGSTPQSEPLRLPIQPAADEEDESETTSTSLNSPHDASNLPVVLPMMQIEQVVEVRESAALERMQKPVFASRDGRVQVPVAVPTSQAPVLSHLQAMPMTKPESEASRISGGEHSLFATMEAAQQPEAISSPTAVPDGMAATTVAIPPPPLPTAQTSRQPIELPAVAGKQASPEQIGEQLQAPIEEHVRQIESVQFTAALFGNNPLPERAATPVSARVSASVVDSSNVNQPTKLPSHTSLTINERPQTTVAHSASLSETVYTVAVHADIAPTTKPTPASGITPASLSADQPALSPAESPRPTRLGEANEHRQEVALDNALPAGDPIRPTTVSLGDVSPINEVAASAVRQPNSHAMPAISNERSFEWRATPVGSAQTATPIKPQAQSGDAERPANKITAHAGPAAQVSDKLVAQTPGIEATNPAPVGRTPANETTPSRSAQQPESVQSLVVPSAHRVEIDETIPVVDSYRPPAGRLTTVEPEAVVDTAQKSVVTEPLSYTSDISVEEGEGLSVPATTNAVATVTPTEQLRAASKPSVSKESATASDIAPATTPVRQPMQPQRQSQTVLAGPAISSGASVSVQEPIPSFGNDLEIATSQPIKPLPAPMEPTRLPVANERPRVIENDAQVSMPDSPLALPSGIGVEVNESAPVLANPRAVADSTQKGEPLQPTNRLSETVLPTKGGAPISESAPAPLSAKLQPAIRQPLSEGPASERPQKEALERVQQPTSTHMAINIDQPRSVLFSEPRVADRVDTTQKFEQAVSAVLPSGGEMPSLEPANPATIPDSTPTERGEQREPIRPTALSIGIEGGASETALAPSNPRDVAVDSTQIPQPILATNTQSSARESIPAASVVLVKTSVILPTAPVQSVAFSETPEPPNEVVLNSAEQPEARHPTITPESPKPALGNAPWRVAPLEPIRQPEPVIPNVLPSVEVVRMNGITPDGPIASVYRQPAERAIRQSEPVRSNDTNTNMKANEGGSVPVAPRNVAGDSTQKFESARPAVNKQGNGAVIARENTPTPTAPTNVSATPLVLPVAPGEQTSLIEAELPKEIVLGGAQLPERVQPTATHRGEVASVKAAIRASNAIPERALASQPVQQPSPQMEQIGLIAASEPAAENPIQSPVLVKPMSIPGDGSGQLKSVISAREVMGASRQPAISLAMPAQQVIPTAGNERLGVEIVDESQPAHPPALPRRDKLDATPVAPVVSTQVSARSEKAPPKVSAEPARPAEISESLPAAVWKSAQKSALAKSPPSEFKVGARIPAAASVGASSAGDASTSQAFASRAGSYKERQPNSISDGDRAEDNPPVAQTNGSFRQDVAPVAASAERVNVAKPDAGNRIPVRGERQTEISKLPAAMSVEPASEVRSTPAASTMALPNQRLRPGRVFAETPAPAKRRESVRVAPLASSRVPVSTTLPSTDPTQTSDAVSAPVALVNVHRVMPGEHGQPALSNERPAVSTTNISKPEQPQPMVAPNSIQPRTGEDISAPSEPIATLVESSTEQMPTKPTADDNLAAKAFISARADEPPLPSGREPKAARQESTPSHHATTAEPPESAREEAAGASSNAAGSLSYQFNTWGEGHSVRISLDAIPGGAVPAFLPSSSNVQQVLSNHLGDFPLGDWHWSPGEEGGGRERQQEQTEQEEETDE